MGDSDLVKAHYADLCRRAVKSGLAQYTRFLDPAQHVLAGDVARAQRAFCVFWGGYDDAERVVAAFMPDDRGFDGTIQPVQFTWNAKFGDATHRDALGALMNVGVLREHFGDILVDQGRAIVFCTPEGAQLAQNVDSIGRVTVSACLIEGDVHIAPPRGVEFRDTLPSLRLDAALASAFNLSRSEAQEMVSRGLVKLKHIHCERGDAQVSPGDMLSLRGVGRVKLLSVNGTTKKGRLSVTMFRYL